MRGVGGEGLATGMSWSFAALESSEEHGDVGVGDRGAGGPVDGFKEEVEAARVDLKG